MARLNFGILLTAFWACSDLKQKSACDCLFKLFNLNFDVTDSLATKMKNCLASIPGVISSKVYYGKEDSNFIQEIKTEIAPKILRPRAFIAFLIDCLKNDKTIENDAPIGRRTKKDYINAKSLDLTEATADFLFFTIQCNNNDPETHKYIKSLSKSDINSFPSTGLVLIEESPLSDIKLTSNNKRFKTVFERVSDDKLDIPNLNHIHAFKLRNSSYDANYKDLIDLIQENIFNYVYSRSDIDEINEKIDSEETKNIALAKIQRNVLQAAAELNVSSEALGDLLSYLFIENEEKAPKLMSKIEFKNYKKNCDGIYLKRISNDKYQVLLSASKIYPSITDGVSNAVERIYNFTLHPFSPSLLVSDTSFTGRFSKDDINVMKKILIPSPFHEDLDVEGFGVFLGYSMNLSVDLKTFPTEQAREIVNTQISKDLKSAVNQLNKAITDKGITQYSYYIYLLPFHDVMNTSKKIMGKVLGRNDTN